MSASRRSPYHNGGRTPSSSMKRERSFQSRSSTGSIASDYSTDDWGASDQDSVGSVRRNSSASRGSSQRRPSRGAGRRLASRGRLGQRRASRASNQSRSSQGSTRSIDSTRRRRVSMGPMPGRTPTSASKYVNSRGERVYRDSPHPNYWEKNPRRSETRASNRSGKINFDVEPSPSPHRERKQYRKSPYPKERMPSESEGEGGYDYSDPRMFQTPNGHVKRLNTTYNNLDDYLNRTASSSRSRKSTPARSSSQKKVYRKSPHYVGLGSTLSQLGSPSPRQSARSQKSSNQNYSAQRRDSRSSLSSGDEMQGYMPPRSPSRRVTPGSRPYLYTPVSGQRNPVVAARQRSYYNSQQALPLDFEEEKDDEVAVPEPAFTPRNTPTRGLSYARQQREAEELAKTQGF